MICPACGIENDFVIDSRSCEAGLAVRRRRRCNSCQHRWTTYERADSDSGSRQKPGRSPEQIASATALAKRMVTAAEALYRGLAEESTEASDELASI